MNKVSNALDAEKLTNDSQVNALEKVLELVRQRATKGFNYLILFDFALRSDTKEKLRELGFICSLTAGPFNERLDKIIW